MLIRHYILWFILKRILEIIFVDSASKFKRFCNCQKLHTVKRRIKTLRAIPVGFYMAPSNGLEPLTQ